MESKAFPKIYWTPELSVNHPILDNQHQQLFAIINSLGDPNEISVRSPEFSDILIRLTDYFRQHFRDEESYMKEIGFPGLSKHIQQHKSFIWTVSSFSVETVNRVEDVPMRLALFLRKTWLDHFEMYDREYVIYAKNLPG